MYVCAVLLTQIEYLLQDCAVIDDRIKAGQNNTHPTDADEQQQQHSGGDGESPAAADKQQQQQRQRMVT